MNVLDDGARTRDLCRDSSDHGRKSLISGAAVALKSIQNQLESKYRTVVRAVKMTRRPLPRAGRSPAEVNAPT